MVVHRMFLFSVVSQEVRFTLDRCSGAAVMEMEGLGSWLTTQDHSSCEVMGVTPNTDRYTQSPEHTRIFDSTRSISYSTLFRIQMQQLRLNCKNNY